MMLTENRPVLTQSVKFQISNVSQLIGSSDQKIIQYENEERVRKSNLNTYIEPIYSNYPYGNYKSKQGCYTKRQALFDDKEKKWDKNVKPYYDRKSGIVNFKHWLPYLQENFKFAKGKTALILEGEKCVDYTTNLGIISTCVVGAGAYNKDVFSNLFNSMKEAGIKSAIYISDHDEAGIKKGEKTTKFGEESNFPIVHLPIEYLYKAINRKPNKGDDIVDFYKTLAQEEKTFKHIEEYIIQAISFLEEDRSKQASQMALNFSENNNTVNVPKVNHKDKSQIRIPLEVCIAPANRKLLKGVPEGSRNTDGIKLAKDLVGTANYLQTLGYSTEEPRQMFSDYASKCSPSLSKEEEDRIYKSAVESSPKPCLDPNKIDNCVNAWLKKNGYANESSNNSKKKGENQKRSHQRKKNSQAEELDNFDFLRKILEEHYWGKLKYNELKDIVELDGQEAELENFYIKIRKEFGRLIPKNFVYDVVLDFALENSYHPIKEYLEKLKPDPEFRIDNLSQRYFGTKDLIYDLMMLLHLIASVKRVYEPGCKKDEMLVLKGEQGARKSTFLQTLYGKDYFTDSITGLDKDNKMVLHKHWCAELAELETITSKKAAGELKGFMSSSEDCFRKPYGRTAYTYKRQSVLVGTVNKDSFLVDETGSRRFTIIPVQYEKINIDLLQEERDKIWAAAYKLYKQGHRSHFTREEEDHYQTLNTCYEHEDSWTEMIEDYLKYKNETTVKEILTNCLNMAEKDIQRKDENRVANCLKEIGFKKGKRRTIEGVKRTMWERNLRHTEEVGQEERLTVCPPSNPDIKDISSRQDIQDISNFKTLDNNPCTFGNEGNKNINTIEEDQPKIEINNSEAKVCEKSTSGMSNESNTNNSNDSSLDISTDVSSDIPSPEKQIEDNNVEQNENNKIDWRTKIGVRVKLLGCPDGEGVIENVDNFGSLMIRFINSSQFNTKELYPIHPEGVEIIDF